MIDFEILPGTELFINDTKCVAVIDNSAYYNTPEACNSCVLRDDLWCHGIICSAQYRHDGKAIHFEKVI